MQVKEEGWLPQHVLVREEGSGELLGAVPLYLKSHSYGGADSWLQGTSRHTPARRAAALTRPSNGLDLPGM